MHCAGLSDMCDPALETQMVVETQMVQGAEGSFYSALCLPPRRNLVDLRTGGEGGRRRGGALQPLAGKWMMRWCRRPALLVCPSWNCSKV
eukprot:353414-Chlamydomonas_euryale.AAC.14